MTNDLEEVIIKNCLEMLGRPVPDHVQKIVAMTEDCRYCQKYMPFGVGDYCTRDHAPCLLYENGGKR